MKTLLLVNGSMVKQGTTDCHPSGKEIEVNDVSLIETAAGSIAYADLYYADGSTEKIQGHFIKSVLYEENVQALQKTEIKDCQICSEPYFSAHPEFCPNCIAAAAKAAAERRP
ncbi:MAG: hypothetical protein ACR2PJ_05965 [Pseudomonadales bacterium]